MEQINVTFPSEAGTLTVPDTFPLPEVGPNSFTDPSVLFSTSRSLTSGFESPVRQVNVTGVPPKNDAWEDIAKLHSG